MTLETKIVELIQVNQKAQIDFEAVLLRIAQDLKAEYDGKTKELSAFVASQVQSVREEFNQAVVGERIDIGPSLLESLIIIPQTIGSDVRPLSSAAMFFQNAAISPRITFDFSVEPDLSKLTGTRDTFADVGAVFYFTRDVFLPNSQYQGYSYQAKVTVEIYVRPSSDLDDSSMTLFDTLELVEGVEVGIYPESDGRVSVSCYVESVTLKRYLEEKLLNVAIDRFWAVDLRRMSFDLFLAREVSGEVGRNRPSRRER